MNRPLLLLLALLALPAAAQPVAIVNAGFEADPDQTAPGAFVVGLPAGWSLWDPLGRVDGAADAVGVIDARPGDPFFADGVPEGMQGALVYLGGPEGGEAGLQQVLATPLAAFTRYTLTVAVGNIGSGTSAPGSSDGGGVFYDLSGFPGYRVELRAGGLLLAADANSLAASLPEGRFGHTMLSFETGAAHAALGQSLAIRLVNLGGPGIEVDFDDVQLSATAVPEPASLFLWLAGGLSLIRRRGLRSH